MNRRLLSGIVPPPDRVTPDWALATTAFKQFRRASVHRNTKGTTIIITTNCRTLEQPQVSGPSADRRIAGTNIICGAGSLRLWCGSTTVQ